MSDKKPIRDYRNSRAVLVGTSDYSHLTSVRAAANSLDRMASLLTSELCGWPRNRLSVIKNEHGPGNLPDRLITLFEDATDVALFYFVGHGQIDIEDQLCLGLVGSRLEPHRRASTSLQFQAVRRAMLGSRAKTKIIILDCCYAGLANKAVNTLGAAELLDRTAGTGAYTIAATSSYTAAWYESGPQRSAQTYFTKYFADLIESGIPDEAPALRLRTIFDHLRERLAHDQRPVPEDRIIDSAGDFLFAYNAAPSSAYVPDAQASAARLTDVSEIHNAIMSNLARRSYALLIRQLSLIDSLEQDAALESHRLTDLYRLDHLSTRMRRYVENLLLLADYEHGYSGGYRWSEPISLVDILRAAASEIEQYERMVLHAQPGIQVVGHAANDVIHLVAEIMENATLFSPESTKVYATALPPIGGGLVLDITDNGIGISKKNMADLNRRLDNPPIADVTVSRRMGMFVVGRLAARHGIRVRLRDAHPMGLTVQVWLPDKIITSESIPALASEITEESEGPTSEDGEYKDKEMVVEGGDEGPGYTA